MGADPPVWISTSPELRYLEHFGHPIVEIGDVAVERHGHDCDDLRHRVLLIGREGGDCVQGIAAADAR
jgi:hypothetical protein